MRQDKQYQLHTVKENSERDLIHEVERMKLIGWKERGEVQSKHRKNGVSFGEPLMFGKWYQHDEWSWDEYEWTQILIRYDKDVPPPLHEAHVAMYIEYERDSFLLEDMQMVHTYKVLKECKTENIPLPGPPSCIDELTYYVDHGETEMWRGKKPSNLPDNYVYEKSERKELVVYTQAMEDKCYKERRDSKPKGFDRPTCAELQEEGKLRLF